MVATEKWTNYTPNHNLPLYMLYRLLFVLLYIFCWPWCCLFFLNPLYSWSACHQMADREFRFNIGLLVYNTKGMTDHGGLLCHLHINFHCRVGERVCRLQALTNTAMCFHNQLSLLIQWHSEVSTKIDASFHSLYIYIYICFILFFFHRQAIELICRFCWNATWHY
jgi:hypothetical protein